MPSGLAGGHDLLSIVCLTATAAGRAIFFGRTAAIRAADALFAAFFGADHIPYRNAHNGKDHSDCNNIIHCYILTLRCRSWLCR